jgi:hypothetical protein
VPRICTVCSHDQGHLINVALVSRESYRTIADRYGLSQTALKRHSAEHIPELLVKAKDAVESADADELLGRVESLQERTLAILEAAEEAGELRTALGAIREARSNLELLARLLGEIDDRPKVNILIAPQVQTLILQALTSYPEARRDVADALASLEAASA